MKSSWLSKVMLFENLSGDELNEIMKSSSLRKYRPNSGIVKEEMKRADEFYVLKKGRVKIVRNTSAGGEVVLAVLGPGDFFGEMALLDGLVRSANVISIEPVEVLVIRKKQFYAILHKHPTASVILLKVLSGRLRSTGSQIKSSSAINAAGRVASTLLALADYNGQRLGPAVIIAKAPPARSLAEMASVSQGTIRRILSDLIKSGYILKERNKITIKNYVLFKSIFA